MSNTEHESSVNVLSGDEPDSASRIAESTNGMSNRVGDEPGAVLAVDRLFAQAAIHLSRELGR